MKYSFWSPSEIEVCARSDDPEIIRSLVDWDNDLYQFDELPGTWWLWGRKNYGLLFEQIAWWK